ncbi:hypothetical protein V1511DRAFT_494074 [Dipodascopsis uninucleata]
MATKYHYHLPPPSKLSPTTRADISTALLELLAKLDKHKTDIEEQQRGIYENETRNKISNLSDVSESTNLKDSQIEQGNRRGKERNINRKSKQERSGKQSSNQQQRAKELSGARKQFWFEKFLWFLSSDGYLVLGGRYGQQTALLFKRHLGEHDMVVSSNVSTAPLVIIKNHLNANVIPPSTLSQAATFALSMSTVWDTNGLADAWSCRASAVKIDTNIEESLKTSDSDEPVEFFCHYDINEHMKSTIPPPNMVMGFGFMFEVDEKSAEKYRRTFTNIDSRITESSTDDHHEDDNIKKIESSCESIVLDGEEKGDEMQGEKSSVPTESNIKIEDDEGYESKQTDNESASDTDSDSESSSDADSVSLSISDGGTASATTNNNLLLPRGKRSKLKKISTKYADQDEEDRALRMKLLGSEKSEKRFAQEQALREKRAERERQISEQKALERETQLQNRERRKTATESQRVPISADTMLSFDEDEVAEVVYRERLVARPARGDILVSAVPVCAPWQALHKLKYKVKILPGSGKRAKAVKQCLQFLLSGMGSPIDKSEQDIDRCWPSELNLIAKLTDIEAGLPVGVQKFRSVIPTGPSKSSGGRNKNPNGSQKAPKSSQSSSAKKGDQQKGSKKKR